MATIDDLRQGDILASIAPEETEWDNAFVLTADCDIAHGKFGKHLTVLPIISASEYLDDIFFNDQCEREIDILFRRFRDLPGHNIDQSFFIDHILTTESIKLADKYSGIGNIDHLHILHAFHTRQLSPRDAYCQLCEMRKTKISKKINDAFRSLRSEYFFLNDIPGSTELGHIVLLRQPRNLHFQSVRARNYDQDGSATKSGSLSDVLRFGIAQAFSNVFSRIGMPLNIEADRDAIISIIFDSYGAQ